jgi:predicted fused transcriptional regulator/phosphomethylpyrimidine kinase
MYTKKVVIKWQRDSYLDCSTADRETNQAEALAELDAKTAEMIAEGKMSADVIVDGGPSTVFSIKRVTDQAAADEWIAFNNAFATKYGFVKIGSEIKPN